MIDILIAILLTIVSLYLLYKVAKFTLKIVFVGIALISMFYILKAII